MITLRPAEHLVTPGLSNLYLILPRQLEGGFDRFRSAAGEVHGASPKILSGKLKQLSRVLFRDRSGELAGVDELQLRQLPGHGGSDFGDSVSDEVYRRGAGKIQVALAFRVPQVNAFAANGGRECLAERTPKNGGASRVLLVSGIRHTVDYPAGRAAVSKCQRVVWDRVFDPVGPGNARRDSFVPSELCLGARR